MTAVESETRREFLKSTAGATFGVADTTTSGEKNKPKILFEESFESGTSTKFSPASSWESANPGIVEAPGTAADGKYMLRMGRVKSTKTTSPIVLPESDPFEISVHVAPLTMDNYVPDASLRISNDDSDIYLFGMIDDAKGNRTIGLNNTKLGEFKTNGWNHVQIRFENSDGDVQVSYRIDGEKRGETSYSRQIFGTEINLELVVGYPTVLWDDITIIQNPDARSQGLLPSGSLFDVVATIGSYIIGAAFSLLLLLMAIGFLSGIAEGLSSDGSTKKRGPTQRAGKPKRKSERVNHSGSRKNLNSGLNEVKTNEYGEIIEDDQN